MQVKVTIEATKGKQVEFHIRNEKDVERCVKSLEKQGFKVRILKK